MKGVYRPIPDILKDALEGKKPKDLKPALNVLAIWYSKGCPSKEEMMGELRAFSDTCSVCNSNDPADPEYGNPYLYHSSPTPICDVKIIT